MKRKKTPSFYSLQKTKIQIKLEICKILKSISALPLGFTSNLKWTCSVFKPLNSFALPLLTLRPKDVHWC